MEVVPFIVTENPGGRPLQISVKRYRFNKFTESSERSGIILLLLHGVGFNKETWEPFLEELAAIDGKDGQQSLVKEAWAIDSPNHGESALLNEQYLFKDPRDVTLEEYARSSLRLLRSGLVKDANKHRVVTIGHSVGACASVWATHFYQQEDKKLLDGCFLIEPPGELLQKGPLDYQRSALFLEPQKNRKDIWHSKEAAYEWFSKTRPWKNWDPRALNAYVRYGLRPLPTVWYPNKDGVTLSLPKAQEIFAYTDLPEVNKVLEAFPTIQGVVPIHVFVSGRSFLRPTEEECREIGARPGFALTHLPPKSDHLCVQEIPRVVAQSVLDGLEKLPPKVASVQTARL